MSKSEYLPSAKILVESEFRAGVRHNLTYLLSIRINPIEIIGGYCRIKRKHAVYE